MWEVLAALIQKQKFCAKFIGKHLHQSLFYNNVAGLRPEACNFVIKETLTQAFSCELCEISKNNFFTEHLWTTASESYGIGSILTNLWFAFIKVTRKKFHYHISFLGDFFCNDSFDVKQSNLIDFTIEKRFYFMFLSNWFDWNVK